MTTKNDIKKWLTQNVPNGATHMAVVCDTFDWEDYPVYIIEGQDAFAATQKYRNGENMTKLMEVYDLRRNIDEQLNQNICLNY